MTFPAKAAHAVITGLGRSQILSSDDIISLESGTHEVIGAPEEVKVKTKTGTMMTIELPSQEHHPGTLGSGTFIQNGQTHKFDVCEDLTSK